MDRDKRIMEIQKHENELRDRNKGHAQTKQTGCS